MDFNFLFWFLLIAVIFFVVFVVYFSKKGKVTADERKFFHQRWQAILAYQDYQRAILDADKLLDIALHKMGYKGSLGEKLKKAGKLFSSIDEVWSAHKFRNRIAHELQMTVTAREGKEVLGSFKRALSDLGFL